MCVCTYRTYECAVLCVVHMSRKRNKFNLASPELHSVILAYDLYNGVCVCVCVCVVCVRVCVCNEMKIISKEMVLVKKRNKCENS